MPTPTKEDREYINNAQSIISQIMQIDKLTDRMSALLKRGTKENTANDLKEIIECLDKAERAASRIYKSN